MAEHAYCLKFSKKIFLIGGGIGMAALKTLSTVLIERKFKFTVIEGAKIDSDLMYMDEFQVYNKDFLNNV